MFSLGFTLRCLLNNVKVVPIYSVLFLAAIFFIIHYSKPFKAILVKKSVNLHIYILSTKLIYDIQIKTFLKITQVFLNY